MRHLCYIFVMVFAWLLPSVASAQYTSSNKKAVQTFEQAMSRYQAEELDAANELADKALKLDTKFLEALWLKADIAHKRKDFANEVTVLKQALTLQPKDENTILALGDAFFFDYKNDSALVCYKKVLQLPRITEVNRNRVMKNMANAEFRIYALSHPLDINPKHLGNKVNTVYNDYFPALSANGQTLVYTIELPQTKDNPLLPYTQEDILILHQ